MGGLLQDNGGSRRGVDNTAPSAFFFSQMMTSALTPVGVVEPTNLVGLLMKEGENHPAWLRMYSNKQSDVSCSESWA